MKKKGQKIPELANTAMIAEKLISFRGIFYSMKIALFKSRNNF